MFSKYDSDIFCTTGDKNNCVIINKYRRELNFKNMVLNNNSLAGIETLRVNIYFYQVNGPYLWCWINTNLNYTE